MKELIVSPLKAISQKEKKKPIIAYLNFQTDKFIF